MARKRMTAKKATSRRECKKMSEAKARKKQRNLVRRNIIIVGLLLFITYGALNGWIAHKANIVMHELDALQTAFWDVNSKAGLVLQRVSVTGRQYTPINTILSAMDVEIGMPMLSMSLDKMRQRIEALDEIESAVIERKLPNHLYVRLYERQPVALWQHNGKHQLIDREGRVLSYIPAEDVGALLVITGEKATQNIGQLLSALDEESALRSQVVAAQYVANRRWNVVLNNGMRIKLPEVQMRAAWKKLVSIEEENQMTKRAVDTIDMRIKDRMYLELAPSMMRTEHSELKRTVQQL